MNKRILSYSFLWLSFKLKLWQRLFIIDFHIYLVFHIYNAFYQYCHLIEFYPKNRQHFSIYICLYVFSVYN